MAIFKCKMCGGTLDVNNETVAVCEYCGTKQTLPKTNDDVISNLFNRANNLRLKCEFDKAAQIYEKIVEQDDSEAEAHWGIVLCKYGIEYVEDPQTLKRIPTCHRASFEAVTTDADYLAAVDYSDTAQQLIYESEARAIDRIQKDILAIVKNEKPFDVFLCYKETDENGKRTVDSAITNDIYYQLIQEGLKVFYAPITLEDKLGQEYEPYIFAALNSAKVMLVVGTKPEYFEAVWVRNEWSRFLKIMKTDRSKLLIPCYRDMDAYELPNEFAHLQAQDMSKIGFINDVVRGIKKVLDAKEEAKTVEVISANDTTTNIAPLLKRAYIFLEDEEWNRADEFCEQVLNLDPENGEAYIVKLLIEYRCKTKEDLASLSKPINKSKNFSKIMRFGNADEQAFITSANTSIEERIKEKELAKQKAEEEKFAEEISLEYKETICPHCNTVVPDTAFKGLRYDEYGNGEFNCPSCNESLFFEKAYIQLVSEKVDSPLPEAKKEQPKPCRITFTRNCFFIGKATVFVDGIELGVLKNNDLLIYDTYSGVHKISVKCNGRTWDKSENLTRDSVTFSLEMNRLSGGLYFKHI